MKACTSGSGALEYAVEVAHRLWSSNQVTTPALPASMTALRGLVESDTTRAPGEAVRRRSAIVGTSSWVPL